MPQNKVLQICGYKNSGKTTLMEQAITHFVQLGLEVAALKSDSHGFDWDRPNTDTAKHRAAGASLTFIEHDRQMGLLMNKPPRLALADWITWLNQLSYYDLYLVEGYKAACYPKIILVRSWADWLELRHLKEIALILFAQEQDMLQYQQYAQQSGSIPYGLRTDIRLIEDFLQQWWMEGLG